MELGPQSHGMDGLWGPYSALVVYVEPHTLNPTEPLKEALKEPLKEPLEGAQCMWSL